MLKLKGKMCFWWSRLGPPKAMLIRIFRRQYNINPNEEGRKNWICFKYSVKYWSIHYIFVATVQNPQTFIQKQNVNKLPCGAKFSSKSPSVSRLVLSLSNKAFPFIGAVWLEDDDCKVRRVGEFLEVSTQLKFSLSWSVTYESNNSKPPKNVKIKTKF